MCPFVCDRKLEDFLNPSAVTVAGRAMAEKGADRLQEATQTRTPISTSMSGGLPRSRPPGTLRDSIQRGPVRKHTSSLGRGWQARVFTEDEIAPYVEWDTRAHEIRPRPPGKALRFYAGGQVRYASVVHHPGTTGQHMFSRAAAYVQAESSSMFDEELARFGHDLTTLARRLEDLLAL